MIASAYEKVERGLDRKAFTLVETIVSLLIVGAMLVAALSTVGASRLSQQRTSQYSRGQALAESLMGEILQQAYADPEYGLGSFGLGGDEIGDGSRNLWDDVDDYDGWLSAPPEQKDGTQIPNLTGWQRSVSVQWVNPDDPEEVKFSESNAKRVIVTVICNNKQVGSLTAIRTNSGL